MPKVFVLRIVAKGLLLVCVIPSLVLSQIKITSPTSRAVYQRDIAGQRSVTISGTFSIPSDRIEARAVPVAMGQGVETGWKTIQQQPKGGTFSGDISLLGGWYKIEVRAMAGANVIAQDALDRLGVGEVFIIAGQSNAQGLKGLAEEDIGPGAEDDRVSYISNNSNDVIELLTVPGPPAFSKITRDLSVMAPRGFGAWCWGILGDLLVSKLNVPVLFINAAWEGSAIENWARSAQGLVTASKYGGFVYNAQMPYANLRIAAKNYANQYGLRSVLWMQGESDGIFGTTSAFYRDNLRFIINKLEQDTGKKITWVIARTSRTSPGNSIISKAYPDIVVGQNAVLDMEGGSAYPGPETDNLVINRKDGTHFFGQTALRILATAWAESLDNKFFTTVTPATPAAVPVISAACVPENNAVVISLPTGYASYRWSTGETGNTIRVTNAGTYSAAVRDPAGNTTITSVVVLSKNAKPATPTIIPQGAQQACADSSFTFSISDGSDINSWYKTGVNTAIATGNFAKLSESGNYEVQGQNIFGCISNRSSSATLVIQPKVPKPTIESYGPFSATASIEDQTLNAQYVWHLPGSETETVATIVKILKTGDYTAKAKVVFKLGNNSLTCYSDTAVKEFKTNEQNEVVVYPNPSEANYVYLESRDVIKDAVITVYDIFGRAVRTLPSTSLNGRLRLDVSNLSTGKYIVRLVAPDQVLTKQIVVR